MIEIIEKRIKKYNMQRVQLKFSAGRAIYTNYEYEEMVGYAYARN